MRSKSSKTRASGTKHVTRQLSDLSLLVPEVIARRSLRVARLGLWSTPGGRSEMQQMVSEKAIASTQSGLAMWTEMMAAAQRSWISAVGGLWFPGHAVSAAQSPFAIGTGVLAKGLAPLLHKTSSNAKRLRRAG